ncbi:MAG: hypothetical protein Ct9H300mP29_8640 [Candidatus Neomarinimicrobiota bacterium]|nr:MAG: hypothetical protein Ct9H300mP29_8640 [Candidatus Neomarinimicrobiota bacterium]
MIAAFTKAGVAFDSKELIEAAEKSAQFFFKQPGDEKGK